MPIGSIFVAPIVAFAMNSALLKDNFRYRPSAPEETTDDRNTNSADEKKKQSVKFLQRGKSISSYKELKRRLVHDFGALQKIALVNCARYFCTRQTKYKKWLTKVENTMQKELELTKFVHFGRL